MKNIVPTLICFLGLLASQTSSGQKTEVSPTDSNKIIPTSISQNTNNSKVLFGEPKVLSLDLNENGDKIAKLQEISGKPSLFITDSKSEKSIEIRCAGIENASQVFFINNEFIAVLIQNESPFFNIIELSTRNSVANIPSNKYIGSTATASYFSMQNGVSSTIERFEIGPKKNFNVGSISGEVFGWYFSKVKGIVGVAVHSNLLSKIYSIEKEKLGKSIFEFSSSYYFETKGCNISGDLFYGITNFQSTSTYACIISKAGLKPLNNKSGENCTDISILGNDIGLSTLNNNATEYQETKNPTFQKVLNFAQESFKGSSIQIIDFVEKNNTLLFCIQSETTKPKYFLWENNQPVPVSTDKFESKNSFVSSEVVQIQTGEPTPQSGRMYLPTKDDKSSFPLVIYIPSNILIPYGNQFNPTVQYLCQNGYAVFVWNTRFSTRPKMGFTYADLIATFSEDVRITLSFLNTKYPILSDKTYIIGEELGGYLALNASAKNPDSFDGVVVSKLKFPGKEYKQDVIAAHMFGEDAQTKWSTLDQIALSEKSSYLALTSTKSNTELTLLNSIKQKKIKWSEITATSNRSATIHSNELDGIYNWLQNLSQIEPKKEIENKPKVDVKKK
jgi:hypothetical protein